MVSCDVKPSDHINPYKAAPTPLTGSVRGGHIVTCPGMTNAIARAIWSKWDQNTEPTLAAVAQKETDTGTHRTAPRHDKARDSKDQAERQAEEPETKGDNDRESRKRPRDEEKTQAETQQKTG